MKLVVENKDFKIYFDCARQVYDVFKDEIFLIGNKYK